MKYLFSLSFCSSRCVRQQLAHSSRYDIQHYKKHSKSASFQHKDSSCHPAPVLVWPGFKDKPVTGILILDQRRQSPAQIFSGKVIASRVDKVTENHNGYYRQKIPMKYTKRNYSVVIVGISDKETKKQGVTAAKIFVALVAIASTAQPVGHSLRRETAPAVVGSASAAQTSVCWS